MSSDARETIILYIAALNARDIERALAYVVRDVVLDPVLFDERGSAGLRLWLRAMLRAIPDAQLTLSDLVVEGERVAARATFRGTQTGMLETRTLRLPATGRELAVEQHMLFRVTDGLIGELRMSRDDLGMLRQLGHLSLVGGAAGVKGPAATRRAASDPKRAAR